MKIMWHVRSGRRATYGSYSLMILYAKAVHPNSGEYLAPYGYNVGARREVSRQEREPRRLEHNGNHDERG